MKVHKAYPEAQRWMAKQRLFLVWKQFSQKLNNYISIQVKNKLEVIGKTLVRESIDLRVPKQKYVSAA